MSSAASLVRPAKANTIATWIIRILLALAFLAAATAKLSGVPMMVQVFDQIGFGQWFRIVTALVEIAGAIALFIPGLSALAALWLGTTMVCAILAHIIVLHTSPGGAVVLLLLNVVLVWLRRDELAALLARLR
jgi:uncharacterized membrane protein YphA (DoxX/SURF4 family)